jgi:methionine sulfoxide reductase heme-binding subunit
LVLKTQLRLLRTGAWVLGLFPGARLLWRTVTGDLGANPIEEFLHRAGDWTLILLLVTLAVTPVRILTGWNAVVRVRRTLGLFAFAYATSHFLIYLLLDQTLDFEFIWEDIAERPFITVGFAAWLILIPLVATSTKGWSRRLGRRWQRLHRVVYVAAALGVIHFYWKVKADTLWPWVAIGALAVLLTIRVPGWAARYRPSQPEIATRTSSGIGIEDVVS